MCVLDSLITVSTNNLALIIKVKQTPARDHCPNISKKLTEKMAHEQCA